MARTKKVLPPLAPDQLAEVDRLCELWQWILDFRYRKRRALREAGDSLAAAQGRASNASGRELAGELGRISYLRGRHDRLRGLCEQLDADLYSHRGRKEPPWSLRERYESEELHEVSLPTKRFTVGAAADYVQSWVEGGDDDKLHVACLMIMQARLVLGADPEPSFDDPELEQLRAELQAECQTAREVLGDPSENRRRGPWAVANECVACLCAVSVRHVEECRKASAPAQLIDKPM